MSSTIPLQYSTPLTSKLVCSTKRCACILLYSYPTLTDLKILKLLVLQAPGIPKRSAEDTSLSVTNDQGDHIVVPIPQGTLIYINVPGLHYNRE
jgi:hypothetical protein